MKGGQIDPSRKNSSQKSPALLGLKRPAPAPYCHPPLFNFLDSLLRELIKIHFPL